MATLLTDRSLNKREAQSAPTVSPESDDATLGEFLRRARERRGLTLQQISKETRIPCRHLDALERGNLAAIPGQFYRRAEIRAYATVVHIDQNLALARLERALHAPVAREAVSETQRTDAPPLSRGYAIVAIGVITAAAVAGLAAWSRTPAVDGNVQGPSATQSREAQSAIPAAQTSPGDPQGALPEAETAPGPPAGPSVQLPIDQATVPAADSETEQDPAGDLGALVVTTEPAGARVTVDGIGWGTTPVTIRHLSLGAKRIRVTKDGYTAEDRVVRLVGDRPSVRLRIPLRSVP